MDQPIRSPNSLPPTGPALSGASDGGNAFVSPISTDEHHMRPDKSTIQRSWSVPANTSEASSKKRGNGDQNRPAGQTKHFRRLSNGQFARKDGASESISGVRRQDTEALVNRVQELEDQVNDLTKKVEQRNMQIIELTGDLYHMKAQHVQELQQLRQGDTMQDLAAIFQIGKAMKAQPKVTESAPKASPVADASKDTSCQSTEDATALRADQQIIAAEVSSSLDKTDAKDFLGEILGNLDFSTDVMMQVF